MATECLSGVDARERGRITSLNSSCLAFRGDGQWLAVGEQRGIPGYRVLVFDVGTLDKLAEYTIPSRDEDLARTGVSVLTFSPDGRWLIAGTRDGRILAWDMRTSLRTITVTGPFREDHRFCLHWSGRHPACRIA